VVLKPGIKDINRVYRLLTDFLWAAIDAEPLWLWLYWAQSPSGGRYAQIYKPLCSPRRPVIVFRRNANRR